MSVGVEWGERVHENLWMSRTPGSNKFDFLQMDPSTTPIATGADHGNTAVVSVNQPVTVVWFPEAVAGPTEGEVESPHVNCSMMMTDGSRVDLTIIVIREVNNWSMFQKRYVVDDGGL
jgi:hypothetical protein